MCYIKNYFFKKKNYLNIFLNKKHFEPKPRYYNLKLV